MASTLTAPGSSADAATARNDAVVEVDDVTKSYWSGTSALRGVSLRVARGEVLAVLGPNGAGKTTLTEIVAGLRDRTTGRVRVLGLDPGERRDRRVLRTKVGVVLQSAGHLRYLTVRETVELHAAYHDAPARVDEVLETVGLAGSACASVRDLSGGQQRRLDVATALVGRPEVILLDEPTTGFDPAGRRAMWDVVRGLVQRGTAVLLTTHYMEEAQALADRVVVVAGGRIVGEGTPAELAERLGLTARIAFRAACDVESLPQIVRGAVASVTGDSDGSGSSRFELSSDAPVEVLAALTAWATTTGVALEELLVEPPSLERSYLALTDEAVESPR